MLSANYHQGDIRFSANVVKNDIRADETTVANATVRPLRCTPVTNSYYSYSTSLFVSEATSYLHHGRPDVKHFTFVILRQKRGVFI